MKNGIRNHSFVRVFFLLVISFVALGFISCASSDKSKRAVLTKEPARFFWKISGTDKNGMPSTVFVQGTFHLADDKVYPLADTVLAAWDSADRVAGELSQTDIATLSTSINDLIQKSYENAEGRNVMDYLNEDEQKKIAPYLLALGGGSQVVVCEPWVLNTILSTLAVTGTGLVAEKSLDTYFMTKAVQEGKTQESLDTLQTQLDVIKFGSYDEQIVMLKQTIRSFDTRDKQNEQINELYDAYVTDDEKKIIKIASQEMDDAELSEEEEDVLKRYDQAVLYDRNNSWAQKIASWIDEGGTTFIFAGTLHFVGKDSVFDYMKKNGTLK